MARAAWRRVALLAAIAVFMALAQVASTTATAVALAVHFYPDAVLTAPFFLGECAGRVFLADRRWLSSSSSSTATVRVLLCRWQQRHMWQRLLRCADMPSGGKKRSVPSNASFATGGQFCTRLGDSVRVRHLLNYKLRSVVH